MGLGTWFWPGDVVLAWGRALGRGYGLGTCLGTWLWPGDVLGDVVMAWGRGNGLWTWFWPGDVPGDVVMPWGRAEGCTETVLLKARDCAETPLLNCTETPLLYRDCPMEGLA